MASCSSVQGFLLFPARLTYGVSCPGTFHWGHSAQAPPLSMVTYSLLLAVTGVWFLSGSPGLSPGFDQSRAGGHRGRERALSCLPPGTYRMTIPRLWSQTTMLTFLNTAQLTLQARPEQPESKLRQVSITGAGRAVDLSILPRGFSEAPFPTPSGFWEPQNMGPDFISWRPPVLRTRHTLPSFSPGRSPGDGETYKTPFLGVEYEAKMLLKFTWIMLPAGDGLSLF